MNFNAIDDKPLLNWINLGNGTLFRLSAFFTRNGGNYPRTGLFIGIERCGCFLFSLRIKVYHGYVAEKLNIAEPEARIIADWMNAQLSFVVPQQGEYDEKYIHETQPYGLGDEKFIMPIVPEIIECSSEE
jgi:hypothetical protein